MTLKIEADERHIIGRLEREKRCGHVELLSDMLWRFTADAYDTQEMLPWLNRVTAFQYISGTGKNTALKIAKELLLDKSAAVRENVRVYLNKNVPDFDYRAYYKSHLTDCTVPAIYGLSETGKAEDTAEIESYLKSGVISIVRAAMTAVMRLDGEKYAAAITGFLADDRAGIVKTHAI